MEDVRIFYGHLINFTAIWYISPRFGMLYQEKSGNPGMCVCIYICSFACGYIQANLKRRCHFILLLFLFLRMLPLG
jgi:hypothetical protein